MFEDSLVSVEVKRRGQSDDLPWPTAGPRIYLPFYPPLATPINARNKVGIRLKLVLDYALCGLITEETLVIYR